MRPSLASSTVSSLFHALAAALVAALMLLATSAAPQAKPFKVPGNLKDVLVCAKLFFENPDRYASKCAKTGGTPPSAPAKSLSEPNECPTHASLQTFEPIPKWFKGYVSFVGGGGIKCAMLPITDFDGLPVYRFKYVGTDKWFYGLAIEDVLRDGRYSFAVKTYDNGLKTLDYEALGLEVPDADEMREAGWRAWQIYAPHI